MHTSMEVDGKAGWMVGRMVDVEETHARIPTEVAT